MDGSITTNKGIALIGKLLAQKGALQITRVAVGDGTPPASPATLNALVHELKNATIESVDNPKNGEAKIVVTVSSIGVTRANFSRYRRRLSSTWVSSPHAAMLAVATTGLMALPW